MTSTKTHKPLLFLGLLLNIQLVFAGAPFSTDDPVPVDYKHIEFYFSTSHNFQKWSKSGNIAVFETNYGIIPNMQLHISLPYSYINYKNLDQPIKESWLSSTELGIKFRFIQESDKIPQIAIYPTIEIPIFKHPGLIDEDLAIYLPIWFQKSWGKFSTYGGGGYWIYPDDKSFNSTFLGWQGQYQIFKKFALGGELNLVLYDNLVPENDFSFNIGGIFDINEKLHLLLSAGQNFNQYYNGSKVFFSVLITP